MIMKVMLFVVVLVSPDGLYKSSAAVVETCPSQEEVFSQLELDISAGIIDGYWATCSPVKIRTRTGGA